MAGGNCDGQKSEAVATARCQMYDTALPVEGPEASPFLPFGKSNICRDIGGMTPCRELR